MQPIRPKVTHFLLVQSFLDTRKLMFALPYGLDKDNAPPRRWDWDNMDSYPEGPMTTDKVRQFWKIRHG